VIPVKKVLSLLAGMVFVLAVGMAYADDVIPGNKDTGDKMIRDEDLQKYNLDQSQSTVNQMPSVPGAEGSAPGGIRDSDTVTKPSDTGPGIKDQYKVQEKKDQDNYRY
jgi:hypothetical protein